MTPELKIKEIFKDSSDYICESRLIILEEERSMYLKKYLSNQMGKEELYRISGEIITILDRERIIESPALVKSLFDYLSDLAANQHMTFNHFTNRTTKETKVILEAVKEMTLEEHETDENSLWLMDTFLEGVQKDLIRGRGFDLYGNTQAQIGIILALMLARAALKPGQDLKENLKKTRLELNDFCQSQESLL